MDRKPQLMAAARRALGTLEIQNASVDDAVQHTATHDFDLNRWSIHFQEDGGKYFQSCGGYHRRFRTIWRDHRGYSC